jgi:hypothetical protein
MTPSPFSIFEFAAAISKGRDICNREISAMHRYGQTAARKNPDFISTEKGKKG